MTEIISMLTALNSMTPIAVIGLFGVIILLLVRNRKDTRQVRDNHLHEVIAALNRIEGTLSDVKDGVLWIKARTNGKPSG